MASQTVEALVEGGKATAAPPLGPALGPLGVNIGLVVAEINKKTASFKGMQVPVKVSVDSSTKAFEVSVGTPPSSQLVKKEAGLEKGSGSPLKEKVADLRIEQLIKIAKMKESSLTGKALKQRVKEIAGTCNSMGVMVEGKPAREAFREIDAGKFDRQIAEEKTELTAEELKQLEDERNRLAEEMKKHREEYLNKAKAIIAQMEGKTKGAIKSKLAEAEVPQQIIDELLPADEKKEEGKGAAKK